LQNAITMKASLINVTRARLFDDLDQRCPGEFHCSPQVWRMNMVIRHFS